MDIVPSGSNKVFGIFMLLCGLGCVVTLGAWHWRTFGVQVIDAFENKANPNYTQTPYQWYAVKLEHKHIEEMRVHGLLQHRPIFIPSYGRYRQGIVLQIPIQLWILPKKISGDDLHSALSEHYRDSMYIRVVPKQELEA